jgi:cyclic beta-1,2-glucan synthetase
LSPLNPFTHTRTPAEMATYKVEPYILAGRIYRARPARPRRLDLVPWIGELDVPGWAEAILGFTKRGFRLSVRPCIPPDCPEFTVEYRYGRSVYVIVVQNPAGANAAKGRSRRTVRLWRDQ